MIKNGFQIWKEIDDLIDELDIWNLKAKFSPVAQKEREIIQRKLRELIFPYYFCFYHRIISSLTFVSCSPLYGLIIF